MPFALLSKKCENKLLLFIFLFSSYSAYSVEVKNSRWSFLFPKIMKDASLNVNSYTKLKVATYLYLGMQLGRFIKGDPYSDIWYNRIGRIFEQKTLAHATILRGMYHTKNNKRNCATFRNSFNYMMHQDREIKQGLRLIFRSTKPRRRTP